MSGVEWNDANETDKKYISFAAYVQLRKRVNMEIQWGINHVMSNAKQPRNGLSGTSRIRKPSKILLLAPAWKCESKSKMQTISLIMQNKFILRSVKPYKGKGLTSTTVETWTRHQRGVAAVLLWHTVHQRLLNNAFRTYIGIDAYPLGLGSFDWHGFQLMNFSGYL